MRKVVVVGTMAREGWNSQAAIRLVGNPKKWCMSLINIIATALLA